MGERLVAIGGISPRIQELSVLKRIDVERPVVVREIVAEKLIEVAEQLPANLSLQIDSGYRSRESQVNIWNTRFEQFGRDYEKTSSLVFDPKKGIPPHTTGGAVDVSLLDHTNKEINLSEPLSKFYMEPQLASDKISERAQELRLMLNNLMLNCNFAPYDREYWHFSYGDQAWANYYNLKVIFGEVKSTDAPRYSQPVIYWNKLRRRIWQVKNKLLRYETNY